MILVYGDIILDILVKTDGPVNYGSDTTGRITMEGGGSAANFAAWAAYLKEEVTFVGKIGSDLAGEFLKVELDNWGVEAALISGPGYPTGKILIFVDEKGERTMITDRGVNLTLSPDELPIEPFLKAKHLHLTGYSFFGTDMLITATQLALKQARERGLSISVDPSSYALLKEFGPRRFLELTANSDLFFPNYEEGKVLTGLEGEEEIVRSLLRYYRNVVLKLGAKGCLIGGQEGLVRINNDYRAQNPDTTGAGDAFAAAFVTGYLKQKDDPGMNGAFANSVAVQCIKKGGGRPPVSHDYSWEGFNKFTRQR